MAGGAVHLGEHLLAAPAAAAVQDQARPLFGEVERDLATEPVGRSGEEDRLLGERAHRGVLPGMAASEAKLIMARMTPAPALASPAPATVASLRAGDAVEGVFACSRKDRLIARTGSAYLALQLRDRTGAIAARAFRDADVLAGRFERGDLVRVSGRVERFRDELQVEVAAISRAEGADPADFLPVAYRDLDELEGFLEHLAREVCDRDYTALLPPLLDDAELRAAWRRAPCTPRGPPRLPRRPARAHRGGGHLALEACQLHPRLNSDLLLTAALVHDLGKTRELSLGADIALSEAGRLIGHLQLGARI